jgi:hypothetical protein
MQFKADIQLLNAFNEIQQPRSEFEMRHFVINNHDTPIRQYAQCVLELSIQYDNLRLAVINADIKKVEIEELTEKGDRISKFEAHKKQIELEQLDRARLGALREFETLYRIWQEFPVKYTRAEIDADQATYWDKRLTRQANNDIISSGRISASNLDALRMIGKSAVPQLDIVRDVERRYLKEGNIRLLIIVATQEKAIDGLPCLEDLTMPTNAQYKILNVHGRTIDDAYDYAVQQAMEDNADFLITIEDDTFPQQDAIIRLLDYALNNEKTVFGGWYPKRSHPRQGTAIVQKKGKRQFLDDSIPGLHDVYTIPMGCTIYPMELFYKIPRPWFVTTNVMTQDSFFSQLAREAGYKLVVDTEIKCKHIDRKTKEIFE